MVRPLFLFIAAVNIICFGRFPSIEDKVRLVSRRSDCIAEVLYSVFFSLADFVLGCMSPFVELLINNL